MREKNIGKAVMPRMTTEEEQRREEWKASDTSTKKGRLSRGKKPQLQTLYKGNPMRASTQNVKSS